MVTAYPMGTSRAHPHHGRFQTVLLATDLSPTSEAATNAALDLAGTLGARLLAVSVIDPGSLRLPGGRFRLRVDQVRGEREDVAQSLVARGRSAGHPGRR